MKYLKNKAQILMLILAILCVQNLMGQRGRHHPPNMIMIEAVKEDLNLSEAQAAQIEKLQVDFKKQAQLVKADETKDRLEKRAAMELLADNQKAAIEKILTQSQQTLLAERKATYKAERKAKMAERKSSRKELKATLETYRAENIEPVILTQRAKLEANLSEESKAELSELRIAFADKKEQREKRKAEWQANGKKRNSANRKAKIETRKAARENDEEVLTLKELVEKYESNIEELYAEIESERTTWEAEQKEIIQQFKQEKGETTHKRRGGDKAHRKGHGKRHGHHRNVDNRIGKGHFLLLDPNQVISTNQVAALTEIKVYPNPATSGNTLDYEVKEVGRIKIELHDEQGKLVKILLDEEKTVGKYQLNIDLRELKNRTYFYVVSDKQGITTKKFLIIEK